MAVTIFGVTGATFGTASFGSGFLLSVDATEKVDKTETKDGNGEVKRVVYYNPTTEISAEWTGGLDATFDAAAVGASLAATTYMRGTGKLLIEEVADKFTNDADMKRSIKGMRYPSIT